MEIDFYKTASFGNDFLYVNQTASLFSEKEKRALAEKLCHRHTGAGADGMVFYRLLDSRVSFEIFNRDGTPAQLSGNGMAGLSALLFYQHKYSRSVILETAVGRRHVDLIECRDNLCKVTVEIGSPDFTDTDLFPFLQEGKWDYEFESCKFFPVSVGNPHVIVTASGTMAEAERRRIGTLLEKAPIFPEGTNVEIILNMTKDKEGNPACRIFFYERGVGPTISSSTGSAAVYATLRKLNRVGEKLKIITPLGEILVMGKKKIYIENLVKIVYKGRYLGKK